MTETQRAAMQAALDDLVLLGRMANIDHTERPVMKALRAALAEPVVEPVAHAVVRPLQPDECERKVIVKWVNRPVPGPLYAAPQAQQPAEVPLLTDDDWKVIGVITDFDKWRAKEIESLVRQKAGLQ